MNKRTMTPLEFLARINSEDGSRNMASDSEAITVSGPITFDADDYDSIKRFGLSIKQVTFEGIVLVRGKFNFNTSVRFDSCVFKNGLKMDQLTVRFLELYSGWIDGQLGITANTSLGGVSIIDIVLDDVYLAGTISNACDDEYDELNTPGLGLTCSNGILNFSPRDYSGVNLGDSFLIDKVTTSERVFALQIHLAGIPVIVPYGTAESMII